MFDALPYDLVHAVRGIRRSPGFALAVILAYALGVGVNAATFSVVDRVFFQAPPGVSDPGAVRRLTYAARTAENFTGESFTTTEFAAFRQAANGLAEIEGYDADMTRTVGDDPQAHGVGYATTGLFHLAGVRPVLGRGFDTTENQYGNPHNVAVLSYAYWQRSLQGDRDVLGRTIRIDTTLFTIVGIAPRGFEGFDLDAIDLWVPLASRPVDLEGPWWHGGFRILRLLARTRSSADAAALRTRLNVAFRGTNSGWLARDSTIRLGTDPLLQARGALKLGRQHDRALALLVPLAGASLLVLIVATTNVASLLLMRALRRRKETAVRLALGISSGRLMRQLIVESLLLAAIGAAAALLIASWTGGAMRVILLSGIHWTNTVVDQRLIVFTLLSAILSGCAAGVAPAALARRRDVGALLRGSPSESGRTRSRLRVTLLATQTALCMIMLAAAGVFLQSLRHAMQLDMGFDPDRLITMQFIRVPNADIDEAVRRISALPTVERVSRSDVDVNGGGGAPIFLSTGQAISPYDAPQFGAADAAYAKTIGLELVSGRFISTEDRSGSQPVVVIDESVAQQFWSGRSPIGDCFYVGNPATTPCRSIVGVVRSVRWDITGKPGRLYYLPTTQTPVPGPRSRVAIRTRGPASGETIAGIRRIVAGLHGDPSYPPEPRLVRDRLAPQLRPWRVAAGIFTIFGVLALAAAAAGIYGLVAYEVTQRTHEIGVRLALGATSSAIIRTILASGVRVVSAGLIAGLACALLAGRVIAALLFDTSPYDPTALAVTCATITVAALGASLVPAWSAARVDPVIALRSE